MRKSTGSYPSLTVDTTGKRVVSRAGAMLLAATAGWRWTHPRPWPRSARLEPRCGPGRGHWPESMHPIIR